MLLLHLFHGRDTVDEDMENMGFDGPVIKVNGLHVVYGEVSIKHGDQWYSLHSENECIFYGGKWYGDWSILSLDSEDKHLVERAGVFHPEWIMPFSVWESRTLNLFERQYGLVGNDVELHPAVDAHLRYTPEEYVEWYSEKYNLDRIDIDAFGRPIKTPPSNLTRGAQ